MAEIIALEAPPRQRTGAQSTDAELVTAVRRGDERAFEELFARYHRRISAYVFGMVKDHARAEDLTQDVFMSALRRMRDTDRPLAFKPWIYEIAKNACIDQFRRSRRAEEVSMDAEEGAGLGSADHAKLVSGDLQPHARLEAKQELDHLQGAFGGLSESHHQILVMREFEGLSYREIGERTGMSRPSVESTLFRARKRLAEEYDELVSGERCRRVHAIVEAAADSTLGARDQRRLARHVSHCQPCRRHAALAGLGDLVPARTGVRAKIAALLPLPGVLRERWLGLGGSGAGADSGGGSVTSWVTSMAPNADAGWAKAVATAATVAVAGVGAGAATSTHPSAAGGAAGAAALIAQHGLSSSRNAPARLAAGSAAAPKLARVALVPASAPTVARKPTRTAAKATAAPAAVRTPPVGDPGTVSASSAPAASAPAAAATPATPATPAATPTANAVAQTVQAVTGAVTGAPSPISTPKAADVGKTIDDTVSAVPQTVQQTVQKTTDAADGTTKGVADAVKGVLGGTLNGG